MDVLFKNKTKYTKEAYDIYLNFHQNKFGDKYKFSTLLVIVLLLFCSIANLVYKNFITAIIFFIALIVYWIYRRYYPKKKIQKERKTEKFVKEKEFTFKFYKHLFTVSDGKFTEKLRYWDLYRVYENESFIYLYLNKDHALLLDKNSFSLGTSNNFMKFIKKKIWFKF